MRSANRLVVVLAVVMTLSACASSKTPVSVPTRPQPPEYSTPCPPLPEPKSDSCDAAALQLKAVYDQYGLCAGRMVKLIEWNAR